MIQVLLRFWIVGLRVWGSVIQGGRVRGVVLKKAVNLKSLDPQSQGLGCSLRLIG